MVNIDVHSMITALREAESEVTRARFLKTIAKNLWEGVENFSTSNERFVTDIVTIATDTDEDDGIRRAAFKALRKIAKTHPALFTSSAIEKLTQCYVNDCNSDEQEFFSSAMRVLHPIVKAFPDKFNSTWLNRVTEPIVAQNWNLDGDDVPMFKAFTILAEKQSGIFNVAWVASIQDVIERAPEWIKQENWDENDPDELDEKEQTIKGCAKVQRVGYRMLDVLEENRSSLFSKPDPDRALRKITRSLQVRAQASQPHS